MNVLLTSFELIKHNSLDICQFQSDYALYMQYILEPLIKYHRRYTEMSFENANWYPNDVRHVSKISIRAI